jgi:hypothetical protein
MQQNTPKCAWKTASTGGKHTELLLNTLFLVASCTGTLLTLSGCPGVPRDPSLVGTPTCLACHDGRSAPDKREYTEGLHASVSCEDCHGAGLAHVRAGGRAGLFVTNPGESPFDNTPALCARCHESEVAGHQATGHFSTEAASCNDCHDVHKRGAMPFSTPNRTPLDNSGFAQLCGDCHEEQTAQFLASTHATSKVATCAACHDLHKETAFTAPPENNQLCQQCHASFFLGLDTEEAVDAHTGSFHPVDPAGTGASRCVSCHMVPLDRTHQAAGGHDHTFNTVPPADSNAMIAAGLLPHPNSCAGTTGCHDAGSPGSGTPFSVDSVEDNDYLQDLYEQIGAISQLGIQP